MARIDPLLNFLSAPPPRRWHVVVLLVGLLHGLTYVFLLPPWQHYDEPGHFETVWLMATRSSLPRVGDYDQSLRRQLAESMLAHAFFYDLPYRPDLNAPPDQPIWIGEQQAGTAPLYHYAVSLIFRALRLTPWGSNVEILLYAARFFSLGLYVAVLWIAQGVMAEFYPAGHPQRWLMPLTLALIPGFVDLMTALNDDVGAVFTFSLFTWGAARLILRGPTWRRALGVLGAALLCAFTKNTTILALPLTVAAGVIALLRHQPRPLIKLGMLSVGAVALASILFLDGGDAALWYRSSAQGPGTQSQPASAPVGARAIEPTLASGPLLQPMLAQDLSALRGLTVTVGAFMWADTPTQAYLPGLSDGQSPPWETVSVRTKPIFYATQVFVPAEARRLFLALAPAADGTRVYYDGVVLLSGAWPLNEPPTFSDSSGRDGVWGDVGFENLARNPSAEQGEPRLRPWVETLVLRYVAFYFYPAAAVSAVFDWASLQSWLLTVAVRLFRTFWGYFSWGHIALPALWYTLLRWLTIVGLLGGAWATARVWNKLGAPARWAVLWGGLALLAVWASVLVRPLATVLDPKLFIPVARYGYPVIILTVWPLAAGWQALMGRARPWLAVGLLVFFIALDVASLATTYQFYAGR